MSAYRGRDLFGSGPHRFEVGGLALRHARHEGPGVDGVHVTDLGRSGRRIVQRGSLVGDTVEAVEALAGAIEVMVDGVAGELVDDLGRVWAGVVMTRFDRETTARAGAVWAMGYEVEYLGTV